MAGNTYLAVLITIFPDQLSRLRGIFHTDHLSNFAAGPLEELTSCYWPSGVIRNGPQYESEQDVNSSNGPAAELINWPAFTIPQ